MSDNYITKEEVLSFVKEMGKRTHGDDLITKSVLATTKCVKDFVMHMPPEDVQPVVHGKWEEDHWCGEKARRCSVCHITQTVNVYKGKVMYQYCPYCGAKMDKRGGADNEVN